MPGMQRTETPKPPTASPLLDSLSAAGTPAVLTAEAQTALGDRAGAKATLTYALHHTICEPQSMQERIARLEQGGSR